MFLTLPTIACQAPSNDAEALAAANAQVASLEGRVHALEASTKTLERRLDLLSRRSPAGLRQPAPGATPTPTVNEATPSGADTPDADSARGTPAGRVGPSTWRKVSDFVDESDLSPEQLDALLALIQREKGMMRSIFMSDKLAQSERISESERARQRTDEEVTKLLGDERGARWHVFRSSRWGGTL